MLSNITTKENSTSLSNKDNYLSSLQNPLEEIITTQLNILNEYNKRMNEIYVNQYSQNFIYIYMTGIASIYHIFDYLLLHTKNMHLSYSSCQNAIYLYIEFINQVTDESNTYLKLSVSDAVLFIYKKTIFDINSSYCKYNSMKMTTQEKEMYDTIRINCNIIKMMIHYIYHHPMKEEDEDISYYFQQMKSLSENINSIYSILNTMISKKESILLENYHCLHFVVEQLNEQSLSIPSYLQCIQHFCQYIKKNENITIDKLMSAFYHKISTMDNPSIDHCIQSITHQLV